MLFLLLLAALIVQTLSQKSFDEYRLDQEIQDQLKNLNQISDDSGIRLSANEDFYHWIVEQGPKDELPPLLVQYWRSLTRRNMEQRLYALYRWDDGDNFTRQRFVYWLMDLNDWYSRYSGNKGTDNVGLGKNYSMRQKGRMAAGGQVGAATPMAMAVAEMQAEPVD